MTSLPTEIDIRARLLQSCPVLADILNTGMTYSSTGEKIPEAGMSTIRNLIVLRRLMELTNPARTLEIGLAHGGSALAIAATHQELVHMPEGEHTAIDPFQNGYLKGGGLAALQRAGLSAHVRHIEVLSQLALPGLVQAGEKFGLIYVDGSHSFDDVFVDFYFCDRLLEVGGHIVFDDCSDARVGKLIRFIFRNYEQAYTEVRLAELFTLDRAWRHKLGRVLGKSQLRVFRRTTELKRSWDSPMKPF